MQLICPQCGAKIPASAVNIATDLAKCQSCGELFKASELVGDVDLKADLIPPSGSRIVFSSGPGTSGQFEIPRAGFSRSDVPMVAFATFWTGFIAFWTFMAGGRRWRRRGRLVPRAVFGPFLAGWFRHVDRTDQRHDGETDD